MKKILTCCSICLLIAASRSVGQTVDEVINKYVDAMGGMEKLRAIKSLYMEGVTVMTNGNEITSRTYKVQDRLYRREIEFGMGSVTMIVTDKEGWSSNPGTAGTFEPMTPRYL